MDFGEHIETQNACRLQQRAELASSKKTNNEQDRISTHHPRFK